jgi:serine/threonine protein kinase/tetratricopeptide (TPR) repeat protein
MVDRQIGHYRLTEKLGAGGMGEVYLAEDSLLHRLVALKILSPELASQPRNLQRFQREARSVAALNHPNIVTIYSVEESGGLYFLTMELVEGKTLSEIIPPDGMSLRSLLDIAVPLAEALGVAHERGIVHRDLKPDNVMVSREGRVKVLDFGIAKGMADFEATLIEGQDEKEEALTRAGMILGTPAYMAPEQILGAPVDHRTDLFAFGVILFEMATGQRPFRRQGSSETFAAILRDTPPPPSSLNPRVPVELDALVGCCLEKDVSKRMQSAADLRERLQALSMGLSAGLSASRPALEPSLPPSSPAGPRWRRPAVLLVLAACIGLALVAGWALFSRTPEIPERPAVAGFAEANETQRPGLAVLPLGNFSGDPEYFVDGMTDCLISSLADIRAVRVISRQSVMRYKGSSNPLPQIARELGVNLIVQGSVMRAGNRVRVTAQLIRAAPEQQLWARIYERDFRDVLSLQREVAEAIAQEIKVKLEPADRKRLAASRPVDPEAYDAYLRGRHARNQRTRDSIAQALRSFQEALNRDPGFALAHAGLADAYTWAGSREVLPPLEAFRQARQHAKAALKIDPDLADAYVALGFVQMMADRDWEAAEASFRRAIALQPNNPAAHNVYWLYLHARNRGEEAHEQIRLAAELDPLSPGITLNLGIEACLAGREEEALRLWKKVQTLDPDQQTTYLYLSVFYLRKGDMELSYQHFRELLKLRYAEITPLVDRAYQAGGRKAALEAAAQALENLSRQRSIPIGDIAQLYLLLGRRDKAMDWLERVYERGSPEVIFFRRGWVLQSLRSEPRFQALLKKIG